MRLLLAQPNEAITVLKAKFSAQEAECQNLRRRVADQSASLA